MLRKVRTPQLNVAGYFDSCRDLHLQFYDSRIKPSGHGKARSRKTNARKVVELIHSASRKELSNLQCIPYADFLRGGYRILMAPAIPRDFVLLWLQWKSSIPSQAFHDLCLFSYTLLKVFVSSHTYPTLFSCSSALLKSLTYLDSTVVAFSHSFLLFVFEFSVQGTISPNSLINQASFRNFLAQ